MKIGIIGGGASGMIAAISAARLGAEVTILESGDRVGRKILATGNGKCNFTNDVMDKSCFRSNTLHDISPYLDQFGKKETLAFFDGLGMLYQSKNGYYYPLSAQASTVLDALRFELERNSLISTLTAQKVLSITYLKDKRVKVLTVDQAFLFDKVVLACGSKASPKTGSDGSGYALIRSLDKTIQIESVVPALVQLRCKETYLKSVAGVRTEAQVTVEINGKMVASERGELQLTDYGVSGIPVFQVSRFASYGCAKKATVKVHLNVMPDMELSDFVNYMFERKIKYSFATIEEFCTGLINKKLCQLFAKLAGLSMNDQISGISSKSFEKFVCYFKDWELLVEKTNGFDMAQICAGGVSMKEIDHHFALHKCPSVFVVGELLDVDGICGGYNLQWAWTSGYLAGKYAARE